jgi:hypothetical protein
MIETIKETIIRVLQKQLQAPDLTEKQQFELSKSIKLLTT